jgi:hypothetical protein
LALFAGFRPLSIAPQSPASAATAAGDATARGLSGAVGVAGDNIAVDLARIGWLTVVFACLVAVAILVLQGYLGYAAVTFAVAVSAAINLR